MLGIIKLSHPDLIGDCTRCFYYIFKSHKLHPNLTIDITHSLHVLSNVFHLQLHCHTFYIFPFLSGNISSHTDLICDLWWDKVFLIFLSITQTELIWQKINLGIKMLYQPFFNIRSVITILTFHITHFLHVLSNYFYLQLHSHTFYIFPFQFSGNISSHTDLICDWTRCF